MASENVSVVNDANFQQEVLDAEVPVLVDFWAEWCGPCKALVPLIHTLAVEHAGKLKVVKLDVQSNMRTASSFRVTNLPTLVVFKDGKEVARKVGAGGGIAALRGLVDPFAT